MKRFLKNIVIFTIPILVVLVLCFVNVVYNYYDTLARLRIMSNYRILIMGDSQMQRINPKYFIDSCYNFASSGEHYYFTYQKIMLLTNNPNYKIKQIVLGVSAHNFSPINSKLFDVRSFEGKNSLSRYYYFIRSQDFISLKDKFRINIMRTIILSKTDWAGFYNSNYANPDTSTMNKSLKMHYQSYNNINHCESQELFLEKIVDLCASTKIQLIFVATPYHQYYKKNVNSHYFKILNNNLKKYQPITFLNYINDTISPSYFSDANHLNTKGAEFYSKMIGKAIRKQ